MVVFLLDLLIDFLGVGGKFSNKKMHANANFDVRHVERRRMRSADKNYGDLGHIFSFLLDFQGYSLVRQPNFEKFNR